MNTYPLVSKKNVANPKNQNFQNRATKLSNLFDNEFR